MEVFHFAGDFKVVGSEWKSESPEHGCDMAEPPDDELQEGVVKGGSCRYIDGKREVVMSDRIYACIHTYIFVCMLLCILSL